MREQRLTKKAEPRRISDVNRDSGTDSDNRRWLRRLVRPQRCHISIITPQIYRSRFPMLCFVKSLTDSKRTGHIIAIPTDQVKHQTDLVA